MSDKVEIRGLPEETVAVEAASLLRVYGGTVSWIGIADKTSIRVEGVDVDKLKLRFPSNSVVTFGSFPPVDSLVTVFSLD
ncbi:MAG: hypothetical protein M3M85_00445 [bacterium]|nr:hypothetical protein [bacterium]